MLRNTSKSIFLPTWMCFWLLSPLGGWHCQSTVRAGPWLWDRNLQDPFHPPERFNTAGTEKASVDKSDKNAVFCLNCLPVTEDAEESSDLLCPSSALWYFLIFVVFWRTEMETEVKQIFLLHSTSTLGRRGQWGSVEKQKMDIEIRFSDYKTTADCVASLKNH